MHTAIYTMDVHATTATRWAMELIQMDTVLNTNIWGHTALVGVTDDENDWIGLYKPTYEEYWTLVKTDGMGDRGKFSFKLASIASNRGWRIGYYSFIEIIQKSKVLRRAGMPEVADESLLDIVQLDVMPNPAEELFRQLPVEIREAVNNKLPHPGILPWSNFRGDTLEEVRDFCIKAATEQAAKAENDRLWDAWRSANPSDPNN